LNAIFLNNSIRIGDEVMKLNEIYCEHIGNVAKYIETTQLRSISLRNTLTQNCYTEYENHNEILTSSQNSHPASQRKRTRRNGTLSIHATD